ncbi:MAG: flagellar basal body protein [Sphingomonas sp.]
MTDLMGGITREMKHLAYRQQVIAENIANSDTPGFKAREVNAPDFADLLPQSGPGTVTVPQVTVTPAMVALGARPSGNGVVVDKHVSEVKPDGNDVTLEDQLMKLGQIQADFATMTNLYRKQQQMLQTALGKSSG